MTRPSFSPSLCGMAWGLLMIAGSTVSAAEPEAAGVVRISKPAAGAVTIRGQSHDIMLTGCKNCEQGFGYGDGHMHGEFSGHSGHGHGSFGHVGHPHGASFGHGGSGSYCDICGEVHGGKRDAMLEYFKCKFGYFIPTGCGGAGCPPFGKYARVYPQDPSYFDQRDGQAWGAAGYGVPIAVPLAPVVGHQYNYSWGTPASRLTPVSRIAPY